MKPPQKKGRKIQTQIFITLLATADEPATVSLFQNPENLRQLVVQVNQVLRTSYNAFPCQCCNTCTCINCSIHIQKQIHTQKHTHTHRLYIYIPRCIPRCRCVCVCTVYVCVGVFMCMCVCVCVGCETSERVSNIYLLSLVEGNCNVLWCRLGTLNPHACFGDDG